MSFTIGSLLYIGGRGERRREGEEKGRGRREREKGRKEERGGVRGSEKEEKEKWEE